MRESFDPDTVFHIPTLPTIEYPMPPNIIKQWKEIFENKIKSKKTKRDKSLEPSNLLPIVNPLRDACVESRLEDIKSLSAGYSLNIRGLNREEESMLIQAIKAKSTLPAIKLMIKLGASLNTPDINGRTALHHACQLEDDDVVEWLLRSGAQWYIRDKLGRTPIHIAAGSKSPKILAILLKFVKGSDELSSGDNEQMSPLHWIVANNQVKHLHIILPYQPNLVFTDIEGYLLWIFI